MAWVLEQAWNIASVTANVATTNFGPSFSGGGAELVTVFGTIDISNGCTGGHLGAHTNLSTNPGANVTSTATNGVVQFFTMGTWNGAAGTPTLNLAYDGGNTGTNAGKISYAVWTGYNPTILGSPGQNQFGTATSGTASVTFPSGINAGDLIIAILDNSGNVTFTAGSGYTSSGTSSVWFTNHRTAAIYTTSLSEPGPSATPSATLTSNTWTMLAIQLPGIPPAASAVQPSTQLIVWP